MDYAAFGGRIVVADLGSAWILDAASGIATATLQGSHIARVEFFDGRGFVLGEADRWAGYAWDGTHLWTRPMPPFQQVGRRWGFRQPAAALLGGAGVGLVDDTLVRLDLMTGELSTLPGVEKLNVRWATVSDEVLYGHLTGQSRRFRWDGVALTVIRTAGVDEFGVDGDLVVHTERRTVLEGGRQRDRVDYVASDSRTFSERFRHPAGTRGGLARAVDRDTIYLTTGPRQLTALRRTDGEVQWVRDYAHKIREPIGVRGELLCLGKAFIDPRDGSPYAEGKWVMPRADEARLYVVKSTSPREIQAYRISDLLDLMQARRAT